MPIIQLFDKYYLADRGEDGSYDETYSPFIATEFPTVDAANEWIKDNTDFEDFVTIIEDVDDHREQFLIWMTRGMVRRTLPKKDKSGKYDYDPNVHTSIDIFNFHFYAIERDDVPSSSYTSWPSLYTVFTHLYDAKKIGGTVHSSIKVPSNSTYETFKKEIEFILTYYSDTSDVRFSVLDYHLSENGNSVELSSDNVDGDEWEIDGSVHHSGTLESCFEYLRQYRYYDMD